MIADQGAELDASDLAVIEVREELASGRLGYGIAAQRGARVTLSRVLIDRARVAAATALGSAHLEASDLVVRDVQRGPGSDGMSIARAVVAQDASTANLARVSIRGGAQVALVAFGADARLVAQDCIVEDVDGMGANAAEAGTMRLERIRVERTAGAALVATLGATLEAFDAWLAASGDGAGGLGAGLAAESGARATLSRAVVEGAQSIGLYTFAEGARLEATDVVVRDLRGRASDGVLGTGLHANRDATLVARRVVVEGARETAATVRGAGSTLELADTVVRRGLGRERDGSLGAAVVAEDSGIAMLERVRIEDVRFAGLYARTRASIAALDVSLGTVAEAACAATSCPEASGGLGFAAYLDGASISARRFALESCALCGVLVGDGAGVDLAEGEVARAPVGVCLQANGDEVSRWTSSVRYVDVGVPLWATEYALLEETTAIEP